MAGYAHPEALVDTAWVAAHGRDPGVRLVEVDVDTSAYEQGHLPGALAWNWTTQLSDPVRRDVLSKDAFERLMAQSGIANDTTVVLYGDNNNWFAAWALWQMKLYGHADVRLMDGGRRKWVEEGRDLGTAVPSPPPARYVASEPGPGPARVPAPRPWRRPRAAAPAWSTCAAPTSSRAASWRRRACPRPASAAATSRAPRTSPGARSATPTAPSSRPRSCSALYAGKGITGERPTITYCRIGERSSHSWFVLKYLLGYDEVKNYDGSWTEWGNLVGMPVEKG